MQAIDANPSTFHRSLLKGTHISLEAIFNMRTQSEKLQKRTKIVCTLGPACWDVAKLVEMIDAGMDIARFNFSHGDHASHQQVMQNLREALQQRPNKRLGLMLDTKGPEIRTGFFREGVKSIELKRGQDLKIVTDYSYKGDETCIACTYEKLPTSVRPGNIILMADGSVSAEVISCGSDHVMTKVLNNAKIGERKNMNLPGVKVDLPVCGEKEVNDFLEFGIPNAMHFIAASFVQCAQDVRDIRNVLGARGRHIRIIPKIENQEGLINFDEILEVCDGIMVARGDLGMEIPLEKVFLAQKMMISKCNVAGKPVIVATQMLESMINLPRPTRAEVSDVANAVLDGADCVMLSGESANGLFPTQAVRMLVNTALEAELCIDYNVLFHVMHSAMRKPLPVPEAVCLAAVVTANDISASCIVALTETGHTARLIAKYKPKEIILAITCSDTTACQLSMVRGVVPIMVGSFQGTEAIIRKAAAVGKEMRVLKSGDLIVAVHGVLEEVAGHTNLLKVVSVD